MALVQQLMPHEGGFVGCGGGWALQQGEGGPLGGMRCWQLAGYGPWPTYTRVETTKLSEFEKAGTQRAPAGGGAAAPDTYVPGCRQDLAVVLVPGCLCLFSKVSPREGHVCAGWKENSSGRKYLLLLGGQDTRTC